MNNENNLKKTRNQKTISSFFFIFALLVLLCTISIPFTKNFTSDEFAIFGFGVFAVGTGLWFLMNPHRKPKSNPKNALFADSRNPEKGNLYNKEEAIKMINDENYFKDDFAKSTPKVNITIGVVAILFGVALIVLAFFSNYS